MYNILSFQWNEKLHLNIKTVTYELFDQTKYIGIYLFIEDGAM